jgi:hypothetical protein
VRRVALSLVRRGTRALARRAADRGPAFPTGKNPGLNARFRWEHARQDPHKPHRHTAFRAVRFAQLGVLGPPRTVSATHPTFGGKIIHTRSCNLSVSLNTTSPGQSRGGAGASLLTADRLSWRVDLLTRLIYVPLGDSA